MHKRYRFPMVRKQDLKLKLSSMLSSTELETQKSELSLAEARKTAHILNEDFYQIHLLLKVCETVWLEHLGEAISQDSTVEDLELDLNMLH